MFTGGRANREDSGYNPALNGPLAESLHKLDNNRADLGGELAKDIYSVFLSFSSKSLIRCYISVVVLS